MISCTEVACQAEPLVADASVATTAAGGADASANVPQDVGLQASAATAEAAAQAAPAVSAKTSQTECSQLVQAEVAVQTDTVQPAPQPPKPGGLRERRLGADEAMRQVEMLREKLALEKEAAALLEGNLGVARQQVAVANKTAEELRQQQAATQRQAATARAAAKEAARRPKGEDAEVQACASHVVIEVQTDSTPFWSHSWQPRPYGDEGPAEARGASAWTQTAAPVVVEQAAQTRREKPSTQDACVGEEVPLCLELGVEAWRSQFSQGMQALATGWNRCAESEVDQQRLEKQLADFGSCQLAADGRRTDLQQPG